MGEFPQRTQLATDWPYLEEFDLFGGVGVEAHADVELP
jgi:hypothetical protein